MSVCLTRAAPVRSASSATVFYRQTLRETFRQASQPCGRPPSRPQANRPTSILNAQLRTSWVVEHPTLPMVHLPFSSAPQLLWPTFQLPSLVRARVLSHVWATSVGTYSRSSCKCWMSSPHGTRLCHKSLCWVTQPVHILRVRYTICRFSSSTLQEGTGC